MKLVRLAAPLATGSARRRDRSESGRAPYSEASARLSLHPL